MEAATVANAARALSKKGKLSEQKPPLKMIEIWAIRIRLQLSARTRDLAMFNLAIDSKLSASDLTKLRVRDICVGQRVASRAIVMQQTTQRPARFEITELTRNSAQAWIRLARLSPSDFMFPNHMHGSPHLSTRQYARLVHRWIGLIGLDDTTCGAHAMHRAEASLIYRRTKNLKVQSETSARFNRATATPKRLRASTSQSVGL